MTEDEQKIVDYSQQILQRDYASIEKANNDSENIRKNLANDVSQIRKTLANLQDALNEQNRHDGKTSNIGINECVEAVDSVICKLTEVEGLLRK